MKPVFNLVFAIVIYTGIFAGTAVALATDHSSPPPAPTATVQDMATARPQAFTVNGWTYSCDDVRQAVASGEDFTADGHRIYSVLLMDCDI